MQNDVSFFNAKVSAAPPDGFKIGVTAILLPLSEKITFKQSFKGYLKQPSGHFISTP